MQIVGQIMMSLLHCYCILIVIMDQTAMNASLYLNMDYTLLASNPSANITAVTCTTSDTTVVTTYNTTTFILVPQVFSKRLTYNKERKYFDIDPPLQSSNLVSISHPPLQSSTDLVSVSLSIGPSPSVVQSCNC